jgi:hypothetical protein
MGAGWSTSGVGNWLAALEKQYALSHWSPGTTTTAYIDAARSLATGIAALTGSSTDADWFWCTRDSKTREKLDATFGANRIVTADTLWPDHPGLVSRHAYTVLDFDSPNDRVQLRNPHGSNPTYTETLTIDQDAATPPTVITRTVTLSTDGVFWMSLTTFTRAFSSICYEE